MIETKKPKTKHLLLGIAVMFIYIVVGFLAFDLPSHQAEARISQVTLQDEVVVDSATEFNFFARFTFPALTVATSGVMVDVSDNTNFPHVAGSGLFVSRIGVSFMALEDATSTVKVGVLRSVEESGATGDVDWIHSFEYSYASDGASFTEIFDVSPSILKLSLDSDATSTPGIITNDTDAATADFATTTKFTSPLGDYQTNPGRGDLVIRVYDQQGTATITPFALYHN